MSRKHNILFNTLLVFIFLMSSSALAACTNPDGIEGQMVYNVDYKTIQYCNDTNWIPTTDRKAFGSGSCTNPVREEGAIIYNEAQNVPQVCIGEWIALGPLNPSAGTGGCSTPTRTEGTIIYNEALNVMQYCDGSQYVRLQGSPPSDPCRSVTTPGNPCPDGSIYVGSAPIGNVRIYTTRCDIGQTWDGSSCTGTATNRRWNDGANTGFVTVSNAGSLEDGLVNHNNIVATDSDSGALGKQDHQAAQACEDLVENGQSDWYLPSFDEFVLMTSNRAAFNLESGSSSVTYYWLSTQWDNDDARMITGTPSVNNREGKENNNLVRCMRK